MTRDSSWQGAAEWYNRIVGKEGHTYHQIILIPSALRLLELSKSSRLIDVGCGQGVFSRHLPDGMTYVGLDNSSKLIKSAEEMRKRQKNVRFLVADAMQPLPLKESFSHALFLLSLQNMPDGARALQETSKLLEPKSKLLLILNHPCFRIPRQSSWGIDAQKKLQFRRIDRYMTQLEIPIESAPSRKESSKTFSYHHPLADYFHWLKEAGCMVETMEEWCSPKSSEGKAAPMENRSRKEFPLFLALLARKL